MDDFTQDEIVARQESARRALDSAGKLDGLSLVQKVVKINQRAFNGPSPDALTPLEIAALESEKRLSKSLERDRAKANKPAERYKNLLDLPEQDVYDAPFLVKRLEEAGVKFSLRTIQTKLSEKRNGIAKDSLKRAWQGTPYEVGREEAIVILKHFWKQRHPNW